MVRSIFCIVLGCVVGPSVADTDPAKVLPEKVPPTKIKFIDVHVHAMSIKKGGLESVAKWMDERNIERCIVSPLNHKGSRAMNKDERATLLAKFRKFKGKIDRMCIIDPDEVKSVDEAVSILRREIKDGAIAFGEHYGRGLKFDDPQNLRLYEACQKVGLPVMFHIDQNKNMVAKGMKRVDHVLKKYPKCNLIAHAYWWRQLKDADRQLQEHANLYADTSGHDTTSQSSTRGRVGFQNSAAIVSSLASSSSATRTNYSLAPTRAGGRSPTVNGR